VQAEDFLGPQPRLVAEKLRQVADSPAHLEVTDASPEDAPLAAGRAREAEQELDRRGLARTVGPEEAENLAPTDGHREAGKRFDATIALPEVRDLDRRRLGSGDGHRRSSRGCDSGGVTRRSEDGRTNR